VTFQPESQAKLKNQRSKQAVALAMQGQWREAITVNRSIIETFPTDTEAYNRLGRAYMEIGEYTQAKEAYRHGLELNPYNTIAQKNLRRLEHLGESTVAVKNESFKVPPHHFIEEIGKAGIMDLQNPAPKQTIVKMNSGDKIDLKIKDKNLVAENLLGDYLGQVEIRHAQRLIKLMNGGNRYSAAILSASEDKLTVIIREEYQDPSQAGQISFPPKNPKVTRPDSSRYMADHEIESEYEQHEEEYSSNSNADNED